MTNRGETFQQAALAPVVTPNRFPHVDALRGLASIGVVVAHCSNAAHGLPDWLGRLGGSGGFGVQLFYVISAYTLLLSFNRRRADERNPTKNFLLRRYFRIAPLYLVAIGLYSSFEVLSDRYWAPHGVTWDAILANVLLVHGWHPSYINGVVHGGWSVGIEFSFYLLFPWLAARLKNLWTCLLLFLAFAVIAGPGLIVFGGVAMRVFAPGANPLWIPFFQFWLPAQMPSFLLGFAAYRWLESNGPGKSDEAVPKFRSATLLLGGIWLLVCLSFINSKLLPLHVMAGVAMVAIFVGLSFWPVSVLVNRITMHLGKISYSIYLLHIAVLKAVTHWLVPLVGLGETEGLATFLFTLGATLGLVAVVSTLTYRYIEEPFIAFGSRLIKASEAKAALQRPAVAGVP